MSRTPAVRVAAGRISVLLRRRSGREKSCWILLKPLILLVPMHEGNWHRLLGSNQGLPGQSRASVPLD